MPRKETTGWICAPTRNNLSGILLELCYEEISSDLFRKSTDKSIIEWLEKEPPILSDDDTKSKIKKYKTLITLLQQERNAGGKCCLFSCSRHPKDEAGKKCFSCQQKMSSKYKHCCYCKVIKCLKIQLQILSL
jgi:hypothetical protein